MSLSSSDSDRPKDQQAPSTCADSLESLQAMLDGSEGLTPGIEAHLQSCAACRTYHASARLLLTGLKSVRTLSFWVGVGSAEPTSSCREEVGSAKPTLTLQAAKSFNLADRVLHSLELEKVLRRKRIYRLSGLALSLACLVSGLFLFDVFKTEQRVTIRSTTREVAKLEAQPAAKGVPAVGETIGQFSTAWSSVTRQVVTDPANSAMALVSQPRLPAVRGPTDGFSDAVAALEPVQRGASSALSPLTDSARRARDLFLQSPLAAPHAKREQPGRVN